MDEPCLPSPDPAMERFEYVRVGEDVWVIEHYQMPGRPLPEEKSTRFREWIALVKKVAERGCLQVPEQRVSRGPAGKGLGSR